MCGSKRSWMHIPSWSRSGLPPSYYCTLWSPLVLAGSTCAAGCDQAVHLHMHHGCWAGLQNECVSVHSFTCSQPCLVPMASLLANASPKCGLRATAVALRWPPVHIVMQKLQVTYMVSQTLRLAHPTTAACMTCCWSRSVLCKSLSSAL